MPGSCAPRLPCCEETLSTVAPPEVRCAYDEALKVPPAVWRNRRAWCCRPRWRQWPESLPLATGWSRAGCLQPLFVCRGPEPRTPETVPPIPAPPTPLPPVPSLNEPPCAPIELPPWPKNADEPPCPPLAPPADTPTPPTPLPPVLAVAPPLWAFPPASPPGLPVPPACEQARPPQQLTTTTATQECLDDGSRALKGLLCAKMHSRQDSPWLLPMRLAPHDCHAPGFMDDHRRWQ